MSVMLEDSHNGHGLKAALRVGLRSNTIRVYSLRKKLALLASEQNPYSAGTRAL